MGKIKITFEAYDIKHSVELGDDISTQELMPVITSLIQSMTYLPESILAAYEKEVERLSNEL